MKNAKVISTWVSAPAAHHSTQVARTMPATTPALSPHKRAPARYVMSTPRVAKSADGRRNVSSSTWPKRWATMRANQWNSGGLKGMYSPLTAGRIQLPEWYISQTTRPSRGSPRSKNGRSPSLQKSTMRQSVSKRTICKNLVCFADEISATAVRFRGRGALDISLVPDLKDQKGPQRLAMILRFGELFVDQPFYVGIVKDALPTNPFLVQIIQHEGLEIGVEPARERQAKTFLLPMDDFLR